jgi:hypothetical protein
VRQVDKHNHSPLTCLSHVLKLKVSPTTHHVPLPCTQALTGYHAIVVQRILYFFERMPVCCAVLCCVPARLPPCPLVRCWAALRLCCRLMLLMCWCLWRMDASTWRHS